MVCPRCGTVIDENCEVCYNCQMEFKHAEAEKKPDKSEKITKKDKKDKIDKKDKKSLINKIKSAEKSKHFKIIAIAFASIVLIVVAVFILIAVFKPNGEKIASKLGKKVGENIVNATKYADVYLSDKSQSKAINKQGDFDYIYESEKMIKVDGVKVPKWVIKVEMKDDDVFSVYYRDYTSQKKNYKGEKLKSLVEASEIETGTSLKKVQSKLKISPLSIKYYNDTTEYRYGYYFINEDKDEERHELVVVFDDDMKVIKAVDTDLSTIGNPIY